MISAVEFRHYTNLAGTAFVLLPDFVNVSFDVKYNDVGALQLAYPLTKAKALGLDDQSYVGAVVVFEDGSQAEVERYFVDSTSDDVVIDGERIRQLTGRSSLSIFEDAFVYPSNWPVTAPAGHAFVDANAGTILRTLILRARNRGCFPNMLETGFSGTSDSTSSPWNILMDQDYATGTGYLQLIQDMLDRGIIDIKLDGWVLSVTNGGSMGSHIPIGSVEVRPAENVSEMTKTTNSTESISTVLIEGEEGTAVERHNPGAQTLLGRRRERFVSQGGIKDAGTLTILADAELDLYAKIPSEETVGIVQAKGLTPFKDFSPSDWIWVRFEGDEAPVERRVRQLAVSVSQTRTMTIGMTLNSIIFENAVKLQRKIDGYSGNSSSYGPPPTSGDNTTPNPPVGLSVSSATFVSTQGDYVAAVSANWEAPTTNVGGSVLTDLAGYELTWKYTSDSVFGFVHASDDTSDQWSPVSPGRQIDVRVRSYDTAGHRSTWSPAVTHTVVTDTTAAPTPTGPTVLPRFAAVMVHWDGFGAGSPPLPMPLDLDRVEIWKSSVSGFQPQAANSSLAGSLGYGGGEFLVSGPFDVPIYIKLVAVDKAGNRSEASVQGSGIPSRINTPDVDPSTIFTDGIPPLSSPAVTLLGGLGIFSARWDGIENHDPVFYDVHISMLDDFVPSVATRVATTPATMITIRALPGPEPAAGESDVRQLQYGLPYFVKIVAFDADGVAAPGIQDSAQMFQVTGADIAVHSVTSEQILGGTITGETLAGELILGSTIKTAAVGQRVEIDINGTRLYNSAGDVLVDLPTQDGARPSFTGNAILDSATVENGIILRSANSEISTDSGVTLASGMGSPISPPTLTAQWDKVRPDTTTVRSGGLGSFVLNPNEVRHAVYGSGVLKLYQIRSTGTRTWYFNMAGAPVAPFSDDKVGWDIRGVTNLGATTHILYRNMQSNVDSWFIWRSDGTTAITNRYVRLNPNEPPTLGNDGTKVFVAEISPTTSQLVLRNIVFSNTQNGTAVASGGLTASSTTLLPSGVNAVLFGTFDYGANRYVVSIGSTPYNIRTLNSSGVWQDNENFSSPAANRRGFIWDGSNFYTYGSDGYLYQHTTYKWTTESPIWWAGYTWSDSDAVGGLHETSLGRMSSISMPKRAKLQLTFPAVPDHGGTNDPDQWRLYLARGTVQPAAASTFFQVAGATTSTTITTPVFSGTAPPATNNFPGANAGWVRSATLNASSAPQFEVDGFAIGRWATINFISSGKAEMTGKLYYQGHEGWTNFTLLNSWTDFGSGHPVPGFRLDPDGYVSLRGMVTGGTSATASIATLPSTTPAVRPPYSWSQAAVSSEVGCRISVFSTGTVSASGTVSTAWINLSGVRFPTF